MFEIQTFSKTLLFTVFHHYGNDVIIPRNLFPDHVRLVRKSIWPIIHYNEIKFIITTKKS